MACTRFRPSRGILQRQQDDPLDIPQLFPGRGLKADIEGDVLPAGDPPGIIETGWIMTSLETQLLISMRNSRGSGRAAISGPSPANKAGTASGDCASKYSMMARVLRQL